MIGVFAVDKGDIEDITVNLLMCLGSTFVLWSTRLLRETAQSALRLAVCEREAVLDPLTGLYNRRFLDEHLPHAFQLARQECRSLSILMIDIDHFKSVNDQHGHQVGDAVLRHVSLLMLQQLGPHDVAVRYGGEEMLIVSQNAGAADAVALADRIRRRIEREALALDDGLSVAITLSAGGAALAQSDTTASELITRADQSLYAAKMGGRNRVCIDVRQPVATVLRVVQDQRSTAA